MSVPEILFVTRFVHVVSGVGWLGEVVTVNFVLLPALASADAELRARILTAVFPFVFRLATVLGGIAVVSGAIVFWIMSGGDLARLVDSTWGQRILLGGVFGGPLFAFHLLQESRWEGGLGKRLVAAEHDPAASDRILRHLNVIPRIGLAILVACVFFMSAATRLP
ncbi:MAG: hypothetical protein IT341_02780 [Chloroflexi bacterium]|nr:hypothetical protein [Chloroflexota bacterium]